MALNLRITTFACGCRETEESWSLREDVHKSEDRDCYRCSVIKPRPAIGSTTKFLRFGAPPASGLSWNYRDNHAEVGVSVFAIVKGRLVPACNVTSFIDRPAYRGEGVVVGYGSDDEVLVRITSIRKVSDAAAMKLVYG